jgi:predicted HicB family RNase H-like nuclease
MVNINITLPEGLHQDLKLAAALKGKPLKDYINDALEEMHSASQPKR